MTTTPLPKTFAKHYTIDMLRDEARQLVEGGVVSRQQPIFTICGFIAAREWPFIESELAQHDYLLRDRIGDLINHETWGND
jgi:hypothetical protein